MAASSTTWTPETRPNAHRPAGVPNRITAKVRAMIEGALQDVGGRAYLARQAEQNPVAFMALLGKIIPKDIKIEAGSNLAALIAASWRAPVIDVQAESKPAEIPEQQPERE